MLPGRNDPCPCGSGRKYKKCHGLVSSAPLLPQTPAAARAHALKACDVRLSDRLLRFARRHHGAHWLRDALDEIGVLHDNGEGSGEAMSLVVPWLQHLWRDAKGMTLADAWREAERPRLTSDEALVLAAWRAAWVSLWEVTEVQPGVGSRLRDALTREERFIHDVSSTATLRRHDTVLAIVLTCDDLAFFGGIHALPLPPRWAELALQTARRICRVRTRPVKLDTLREREVQLDVLVLWMGVVDEMMNQPPPTLQNTDGDPFQLTTDHFAIPGSRAEVAARLAALPGAHEEPVDEEGQVFVLTKPGNATQESWRDTVIGRLVLTETQLRVETNSARRADALRAMLDEHLKGLLRFRLRSEANTAALMAQARRSRDHPDPEPAPPEAMAAARAFRDAHMRRWIDESIPALGGLTPREAATTARGRRELSVLLKTFEQSEARYPEDQRIDLGWIRNELDLP